MGYFLLIALLFIILPFGISWLLTKGVIFVAYQLFNINWYDKFWAVFVAILLVNIIIGGLFKRN